MNVKRGMTVLGTAAAVTATVLATTASPSAAAGKNGVVEPGELGLYFLQNFNGPVFDLFLSDSNFADDVFPGTGINANNNTESDWNRDTFFWHVFTGANFTGSDGRIAPGEFGNFNTTFRNTVTSAFFSTS